VVAIVLEGLDGVGKSVNKPLNDLFTLRQEIRGTGGTASLSQHKDGGPVFESVEMPPLVTGIDLDAGVFPRFAIANFMGFRRVYVRQLKLVITAP
jgi:hypothetical protein